MLFDELCRELRPISGRPDERVHDERRLGLHPAPGTVIVAAATPVVTISERTDLAGEDSCTSITPDRSEVLDYLDSKGTHPGIISFFAQVADAMYCPLLQMPYKPKAVPRAIEAFSQIQAAMSEEEFEDIGHEIAEGLVGEHASGLVQAIKNALEIPLTLQDFLTGTGIGKLVKWGGNSKKVAMFNESLMS